MPRLIWRLKTKNLLIVTAVALAAGITVPARAGVSVNVSFGLPVSFQLGPAVTRPFSAPGQFPPARVAAKADCRAAAGYAEVWAEGRLGERC